MFYVQIFWAQVCPSCLILTLRNWPSLYELSFLISEIYFLVIFSYLCLKELLAPWEQDCVLPTSISSPWPDLSVLWDIYPYCPKKETSIYLKAAFSTSVSLSLLETRGFISLFFFLCWHLRVSPPPPRALSSFRSQESKCLTDGSRLWKLIHSVLPLVLSLDVICPSFCLLG